MTRRGRFGKYELDEKTIDSRETDVPNENGFFFFIGNCLSDVRRNCVARDNGGVTNIRNAHPLPSGLTVIALRNFVPTGRRTVNYELFFSQNEDSWKQVGVPVGWFSRHDKFRVSTTVGRFYEFPAFPPDRFDFRPFFRPTALNVSRTFENVDRTAPLLPDNVPIRKTIIVEDV